MTISGEIVMCIYLFVELFTQGIRIWIVLSKISISYRCYFREVLYPIGISSLFAFIPFFLIHMTENEEFSKVVLYMAASFFYVLMCILIFGMKWTERIWTFNYIKKLVWIFIRKVTFWR